jgi:hypothetical protein
MTANGAVAQLPERQAPKSRRSLRGLGNAVAAGTTPVKLLLLMLALLVLVVLWAGIAGSAAAGHSAAARNVLSVSEPLSLDAQRMYRSLSDADATEAAAFLSGGQEPLALRRQYQADIAEAARELEAATAAAGGSSAGPRLATLSADLPVYTGLVETARADNRLGIPLGAAYLREASGLMRSTLLPAARELYAQENAQLAAASQQATAVPYAAFVVALLAAIVLIVAQRWLARRTHRVINPGLTVASVAGLVSLIWLVTAFTVASVQVGSARDHGSTPVDALARADIAALRAHADESLTLIDRSGDDSFQRDFVSLQKHLGPGPGSLLTAAATATRGSPAASETSIAVQVAAAWYAVHADVRSQDDSGHYTTAVKLAIGSRPGDSGALFSILDGHLTNAMASDQASFRSAAQAGQDALAGLEAGVIVLSLTMAAGVVWGISRRLTEYR